MTHPGPLHLTLAVMSVRVLPRNRAISDRMSANICRDTATSAI